MSTFPIYCFWTGTNQMSNNRINCIKNLKETSGGEIIIVNINNLNNFILDEHPLHEAYNYLSETHKADYLRTYFMNFYGGGYSDIKKTTGNWSSSEKVLMNNNEYWICGYKEIFGGVAYKPLENKWNELIGNCAYICKKNTPLTNEWYNEMIFLLDSKLELLRKNPAKYPQDCAENRSGYPIEWNEMLGRIFHKVCYKYKNHILNTLPICNFSDYR